MSDSEGGNGLSLFDETASAAGNFPTALRGYDRAAVDEYVRALESRVLTTGHQQSAMEQQVSQLQAQAAQLQRELDTRPTGEIDYSSLGGRASNILRLAEEEAREMMEKATTDAKALRDAATREAEDLRSTAETEGAEIKSSGTDEIARLRDQGVIDVRPRSSGLGPRRKSLVDAARREAEARPPRGHPTGRNGRARPPTSKARANKRAAESRGGRDPQGASPPSARTPWPSCGGSTASRWPPPAPCWPRRPNTTRRPGARLSEDLEQATKLRSERRERGRADEAAGDRRGRRHLDRGQEAGRPVAAADPGRVRLAQRAVAARNREPGTAQAGRAEPVVEPVRTGLRRVRSTPPICARWPISPPSWRSSACRCRHWRTTISTWTWSRPTPTDRRRTEETVDEDTGPTDPDRRGRHDRTRVDSCRAEVESRLRKWHRGRRADHRDVRRRDERCGRRIEATALTEPVAGSDALRTSRVSEEPFVGLVHARATRRSPRSGS